MLLILIEFLPFLLSSITSIALVYYQIPLLIIQQAVSVLLVILLVLLIKQKDIKTGVFGNPFYKVTSIYLLSLFIQLLVIATGGFFSPLLIIVHIYTLGISFLLNTKSSISFLVMTLGLLILNTQLNSNMLKLFMEDPSSVILYVVSFLVIIPLAQTVSKTYHFKDAVTKKLGEYLQISENRSASLLSGLNDLIVITDINLSIISVNQIFEKRLKISEAEVTKKPLLNCVSILDSGGNPASSDSLQINNILRDKYVRIIEDYSIKYPGNSRASKATIQIRPIMDNKGQINQIVFVISDQIETGYQRAHNDLETARIKQKDLFMQIQKSLILKNLFQEEVKLMLLNKMNEDILIAQEIEDHAVKKKEIFEDIAFLGNLAVKRKMNFAKYFNVKLSLNILDDSEIEFAYFKLRESSQNLATQSSSNYTMLTDPKWVGIIMDKLIEICILLSSNQPIREVSVIMKHQKHGSIIALFAAPVDRVVFESFNDLLAEYYGQLGMKTNLSLGSGLEGMLIKKISDQLNYKLELRADVPTNRLFFSLTFSSGLRPIA